MRHSPQRPRLALFFKDFSHWVRASCVGLQVAGYTTAQYLRHIGVDANAHAVRSNMDVVRIIERSINEGGPITHVAISAPWLTLHDLKALVQHFRSIKFVVICHSNVGFLQADPGGIELLRKYAQLSRKLTNLHVAGNSPNFVDWFTTAYREQCLLLPNLYLVKRQKSKRWRKDVLRIGALGAIRPEKNLMTAAGAAVAMRAQLNIPVELHMSTGGENCRCMTLSSIEQMVADLPNFKLVRHHWNFWDQFIKLIGKMDLVIQVSYTESFNMVTADAISQRVPVVVSPPIYWAPRRWKANPDDAIDVARVGRRLLRYDQGYRGADALLKHDADSSRFWIDFVDTRA